MGLFKKPTSSSNPVITPPPTPQTVSNLLAVNLSFTDQFLSIVVDGDLRGSFKLSKITFINSSGNVLQLFSDDALIGVLTFTTRLQANTALLNIQTAINALTA